jgi:hypothetical protein
LIDYKNFTLFSYLLKIFSGLCNLFTFPFLIYKWLRDFYDRKYDIYYSNIKNPVPNKSIDYIEENSNSQSITKNKELDSKLGPDEKTPLSNYIEQALVGLLLGDGTLVKKYKGGGTYFKYAQSTIHSEYLFFVFHLFKELGTVNMENPSLGTSIVKGKSYNYYTFTTKSLQT